MSLPSKGNEKSYQQDQTIVYLIVGFMLFFALSIVLHKYFYLLLYVWKIIFLPLIKVMDYIAHSFLGKPFNSILGTTASEAHELREFIINTSVTQWSQAEFIAMNHFIGRYLLIIFFPVGTYLLVRTFKSTQPVGQAYQQFKDSSHLNDYMALVPKSKETYPALSCAEFCKKYQLITGDQNHIVDDINVDGITTVFSDQLGACYKTQADIFDSTYGWVADHIVNAIPLVHRTEAIEYALEGHEFISTALISLLTVARRFGVLPIASFLKLKAEDRALWYAIASLGRQVTFIEGAGIMAQFYYEENCKDCSNASETNRSVLINVESAVTGVMEALLDEPVKPSLSTQQSLRSYLQLGMIK